MARLHEHEGKRVLAGAGVPVPRGRVARSAAEARLAAADLARPVVVKAQAWTTSRLAAGAVRFADTPDAAADAARDLLAMRLGGFPVDAVLVEERLSVVREVFLSISIDDAARAPVLLVSASGGSGVEGRAGEVRRLACDVGSGPDPREVRSALLDAGVDAPLVDPIADAAARAFAAARSCEARSLEINPLAATREGGVVALDCRITIDDYAVFRHPDLGIEVARELDHPPTELERIAYRVEQEDHRGTFYFAQLPAPAGAPVVGFHGAGGGGSMMSMDALTERGLAPANFCDTSGNPSASKVYRAARIILSQRGILGYFASGSGVASQEQFWSGYGLAKAFWELALDIPAVIRLGGNAEDRAMAILHDAARDIPGPVEAYGKDDSPAFIAERMARLVAGHVRGPWRPRRSRVPHFVGSGWSAPVRGGRVWIDLPGCDPRAAETLVRESCGLFRMGAAGHPEPAVSPDDLAQRDSELIGCEVELRRRGCPVLFVTLEIPGLE
jgi:succinyl-CoA synthetase beta subunit